MTTLIKNIVLVDGSGKAPFKGDVLIRDEKIAAIGSFPSYKADKIIFGNESYLFPGFIDMNASSDRYMTLFSSPLHKDFLSQGITSALIGHCGFSLAPSFYGSLDHFWSWSKTNHVNINWKKVKEFLNVLEKNIKPGVNIGTMAGHMVIRQDIIKEREEFRNLTANELRVFRSVVLEAMSEGAFGLSFGLGYFPYQQTTYYEIRALLDAVKKSKGFFTVHLKNEKLAIVDSVQEVIKLSRELGITGIISHLRPFFGFEKGFEESIKIIEENIATAQVYFDANPFSSSAVPIDSFIPDSFKNRDRGLVLEKIKDKEIAKKFIDEFPKIDPQKVIILNAPGVEFLNGKTLYEFAQNRDIPASKSIVSLMEATKLRGVIFYENLNQKEIEKAILSPRSLISSNSANFDDTLLSFKPQRSYQTFPEFFKKASGFGLSIEKAVSKVSGLPAKILNLDGRGFISSGYFADLVLMNKDFDISMVMINGQMAVENSQFNKNFKGGGKVLRKSTNN
ncbi:MAG: amidohydrolase family protein [Candidatus Paceibacterota bacterium]